LVVKLPPMGGLAFHCHERLTNTTKDEDCGRRWKKMQRKWVILPLMDVP